MGTLAPRLKTAVFGRILDYVGDACSRYRSIVFSLDTVDLSIFTSKVEILPDGIQPCCFAEPSAKSTETGSPKIAIKVRSDIC